MTISLSPSYKKEVDLSMRNLIISLMIAILMVSGMCLAQEAASPQNGTGTMPEPAALTNESQNVSIEQNATLLQNATEAQNATPQGPPVPVLEFIWSIDGIEPAPGIIMMLEQDGQDLFGAAKYEPEGGQPWNAVVVGSVSGDKVDLAITALNGSEQASSMLTGMLTEDTFGGKSIAGRFFTLSEGKISSRGDFTATIAYDDISSYVPAKIEEPKVEEPVTSAQPEAPPAENQTGQQPVQLGKSRFTPVESLKDKYYVSTGLLSEVPIGMEGSL
jgi:hypothetical protein